MHVPFHTLPNHSRIWIYQANRALKNEEVAVVTEKVTSFIEHWKRHGEDLKASFQITYQQFLILAVDEQYNSVSGCAIDASVRCIKELESALQIDFTNKLNIAFKQNDWINLVSLSDFQDYAKQGKISSETIVFNNMIQTKQALENQWEVPVKDSWHQRFVS